MAGVALLEAAILSALGNVVCSLQKGRLPLLLTRTERLGVHLVLCTKEVIHQRGVAGLDSSKRDGLPKGTDALPGFISSTIIKYVLTCNFAATHTFSKYDIGSRNPLGGIISTLPMWP